LDLGKEGRQGGRLDVGDGSWLDVEEKVLLLVLGEIAEEDIGGVSGSRSW
jgi:hypothetical protein